MADAVPVYMVMYDEPSDVDVKFDDEDTPIVQNHDELEKTDVVRGMSADEANEYGLDVIDPSDSRWREEYSDIDIGDEYEI
jgi:hypothetical protein